SSSAAAICTTASAARTRPPRPTARLPAPIASTSETRVACQAGATPLASAARHVSASANAVSRQSTASTMPAGIVPAGTSDGPARPGRRPPGAPARQREQQAFGQQLPNDAAPAAADRGADGELARPSEASRKQQVRDVRARHQQDEHDAGAEHERRAPERVAD